MNQKIRHGPTEHRSVHILETLTRLNLAHTYSPLRPLVAPVAQDSIDGAVIVEIPHLPGIGWQSAIRQQRASGASPFDQSRSSETNL
jgi:hypothetical protein